MMSERARHAILAAMSLEMKPECERCGIALTGADGACICSKECTYCAACAARLAYRCRNCDGELVWRPRIPGVDCERPPA